MCSVHKEKSHIEGQVSQCKRQPTGVRRNFVRIYTCKCLVNREGTSCSKTIDNTNVELWR